MCVYVPEEELQVFDQCSEVPLRDVHLPKNLWQFHYRQAIQTARHGDRLVWTFCRGYLNIALEYKLVIWCNGSFTLQRVRLRCEHVSGPVSFRIHGNRLDHADHTRVPSSSTAQLPLPASYRNQFHFSMHATRAEYTVSIDFIGEHGQPVRAGDLSGVNTQTHTHQERTVTDMYCERAISM